MSPAVENAINASCSSSVVLPGEPGDNVPASDYIPGDKISTIDIVTVSKQSAGSDGSLGSNVGDAAKPNISNAQNLQGSNLCSTSNVSVLEKQSTQQIIPVEKHLLAGIINYGFASTNPQETSNSAQNLQLEHYLQRLGNGSAELTFVVTALVLGSFGSFMSPWTLWMCWAILLLKLLTDFSIRPSWMWVTSYSSSSSSGLVLSTSDRARGESSAAFIKIVLATILLVKVKNLELSAGCSERPCSDRAKESIRGLAVMVMVLEGIPWVLLGAVQARSSSAGIGFKRVKRSYHLLQHAVHEFRCDRALSWPQFALILQSFHASASSAVLVSTAGLLVGGNFGNFMTRNCFWLCFLVVIVELLAERACPIAIEIFRYWRPPPPHDASSLTLAKGLMERENRKLKEEAIAKLLLRVPVQAILCGLLIKIVRDQTYYPPNIEDNNSCDATCRANTRALLKVLCVFTGSQVLSIFPLWAPLQILAALLPGFLAYGLILVLIAIVPLVIMGYLVVVIRLAGANNYPAIDVAIAGLSILLYGVMYMTTSWKRRWLSPKLHYTLLAPMVTLGFLLTIFIYSSALPGIITVGLLVIVYVVLLARGIRSNRAS